ncbi:hypothetical protein KUTeg_023725 [Tegillarca granosa]|uniref:Uncharacterized protein n=1 Tax=Tegillarca granosa TaxID=220873 RepID=A0ABQ9E840_TEGGR|nr:hypothetical protein KUTeg_023725 [Tegillarca granosa]
MFTSNRGIEAVLSASQKFSVKSVSDLIHGYYKSVPVIPRGHAHLNILVRTSVVNLFQQRKMFQRTVFTEG